jgi:glycosyltransferase involved in cell wall biosynthesis
MSKISVIVITENEERNIERCLRSVQWADELVVVDAFSRDKTQEIVQRMGGVIFLHRWDGFAIQKQFALDHASGDWVLSLDADEEVTPELALEIRVLISKNPLTDGYQIPRKSFFLGEWIRYGGWYPGYQVRLFRRTSGKVIQRPVHEGFSIDGTIGNLSSPINHYTYHSLQQYIEKLNDYTSLDVLNKIGPSKKKEFGWTHFVFHPVSLFVRKYFFQKGYKDGYRGFLIAVYSAFYNHLLYAKCWEYQHAVGLTGELPPVSDKQLNVLKSIS